MDERVDRFREDLVAFNRQIRTKRADHFLTSTQLQALGRLDREGSMSARALAQLEQVTPQSIARTVGGLEDLGMVARTVDPLDARANIVSITDAGYHTLILDRARHSEWLAAVLDEKCTEAERELLFIAGGLLRRLSESTDVARRTKAEAGL